jgi:hypothetical protein
MAVGIQANYGLLQQQIGQTAISLRNDCRAILNLWRWVNNPAVGQAGLVALGFSTADAANAIAQINFMATIAQIYTGTATQSVTFDFDNQLSPLWGGN